MRLTNDSIISSAINMSSSWTSEPIWLGFLTDFSIQLFFSGEPSGVFRLQCSNDREQNVETAAGVSNWTIVSGSTQVIDEEGDHSWSVANAGYRWVRVQWIPGAGSTGSINIGRINGKS